MKILPDYQPMYKLEVLTYQYWLNHPLYETIQKFGTDFENACKQF